MEINKIKQQVDNIENKNNKILFITPDITTPSASIYEIFFHAHVMKKNGYNVKIITESDDITKPYWIEDEICDVDIVNDSKMKLSVGPEDLVIIPDVLSNIFEQTRNIPSIRVGFLQSIDYCLNSLLPGSKWSDFGITNVVTTSKKLSDIFINIMGKQYNIKHYNIGIPSYFKNNQKNKKPIISIIYRNKHELGKVIKTFYLKYPQYSWITFDGMLYEDDHKQLSRVDFAKRLDECFAAVWIDRISNFGTFPLECVKCKTIPISIIPEIIPEYVENSEKLETGIWCDNIYEIPDMIASCLNSYIEDGDDYFNILNEFDKIENLYRQDESEKEILSIYEQFIEDRKNILNEIIKKNENEE